MVRPSNSVFWMRRTLPKAESLNTRVMLAMPCCACVASSLRANPNPPSPLTDTTTLSGAPTLTPSEVGIAPAKRSLVARRHVRARLVDREAEARPVGDLGHFTDADAVVRQFLPDCEGEACLRMDRIDLFAGRGGQAGQFLLAGWAAAVVRRHPLRQGGQAGLRVGLDAEADRPVAADLLGIDVQLDDGAFSLQSPGLG